MHMQSGKRMTRLGSSHALVYITLLKSRNLLGELNLQLHKTASNYCQEICKFFLKRLANTSCLKWGRSHNRKMMTAAVLNSLRNTCKRQPSLDTSAVPRLPPPPPPPPPTQGEHLGTRQIVCIQVSKRGARGGHYHRLYSHNCDRSRFAVNGQSRSKGCSQRSKRIQNRAVCGQSVLRNTAKWQIWVGLRVRSKVKAENQRSQRSKC